MIELANDPQPTINELEGLEADLRLLKEKHPFITTWDVEEQE